MKRALMALGLLGWLAMPAWAAVGDQWILGIHHIDNQGAFTEHVGAGWGAYVLAKSELNREIGEAVLEIDTVDPIVGARFPLEEAPKALQMIDERGALGKVVLEVRS